MKQIRQGEYKSPTAEIFGVINEGVLCSSAGKEYEGNTSEGYTSSDNLFEIF